MNKKFVILCFCLVILPACGPWNFRASRVHKIQQKPLSQKAYLYISDVECDECFKLLRGILLAIKGIHEVSVVDQKYTIENMPGSELNPVVISYDPTIKLNKMFIRMVLKDWNFDFQKINT